MQTVGKTVDRSVDWWVALSDLQSVVESETSTAARSEALRVD